MLTHAESSALEPLVPGPGRLACVHLIDLIVTDQSDTDNMKMISKNSCPTPFVPRDPPTISAEVRKMFVIAERVQA